MISLLPSSQSTEVFYPSSDSEPLAESYVHLCALVATLEVTFAAAFANRGATDWFLSRRYW